MQGVKLDEKVMKDCKNGELLRLEFCKVTDNSPSSRRQSLACCGEYLPSFRLVS